MNLSELGEFGLIRRIRKLSPPTAPSVLIGPGDDAAALKLSASHTLLATTDLLLEDVHFDLSYTDYYSLGWKAAAVNLSDIAAMGGKPLFCLTALGIPRAVASDSIMDFYRGFNKLLGLHTASLAGGDTCSSRGGLVISVTAIGEAKASGIIKRSGAKAGDRIFVTGTLGDSAAGMELLQMRSAPDKYVRGQAARGALLSAVTSAAARAQSVRNIKANLRAPQKLSAMLIERHLRPRPRINEGRMIAVSGCASAMIDVSDGLSSDLHHICTESGVGAQLLSDRIPLSPALQKMAAGRSRPAVEYALSGGEDYELLFTVPESRLKKLRSLGLAITEIGTITPGSAVILLDSEGRKSTMLPKGYDHFRHVRTAKRRKKS